MIELINNKLIISFPEVHRDAKATVEFQRTLRIPDDDTTYPLPPGLGKFPLKHIEDFSDNIDSNMLKRGGIIMPMYQSEAVWLNFESKYPFALKIGTGKINAVSGETWAKGLRNRFAVSEVGSNSAHRKQDYVVTSLQPWLDGYCVEKDIIKQFVAAKMGDGATVEEQLSPQTQYGGIQLEAYPLKAEKWVELEKLRIAAEKRRAKRLEAERGGERAWKIKACASYSSMQEDTMGVCAGGRIKQQIFADPHEYSAWDTSHVSRCWVHLCNSSIWEQITGTRPPLEPFSAKHYNDGGFPWFDYYKEDQAIEGSNNLKGVKGVQEILGEKDEPVDPSNVKNVTVG